MKIKDEYLGVIVTIKDRVYKFADLTNEQIKELELTGFDMTEFLEPKQKTKKHGRGTIQSTMDEQKGDNEDLHI